MKKQHKSTAIRLPVSGDLDIVIPQKFVAPLRNWLDDVRLSPHGGEITRLQSEAVEWLRSELRHV